MRRIRRALGLAAVGFIFMVLGFMSSEAYSEAPDGTYGLHLFFDEKEFIDVLELRTRPSSIGDQSIIDGTMIVPDDFTGEFRNGKLDGLNLNFELLVPKNAARPNDLIFVYHLRFFDLSRAQFNGFVTLKDDPKFVASFVGFKR
jgi:hypothetical protein